MIRPELKPAASPSGPDLSRLVDKACAAHRDGDLAAADRLYRAVLARDPGNFDVLHLAGCLNHELGRHTEALRFFAAAIRRNACSAAALSDLGLALHALERYADALASHDAALALEPDNCEIINRRAVALLRLDQPEAALAALDRLLAIAPGHVDALGNRGNVLVRLNRPEQAIASYDAALRIAGDNPQLLTNRAHALRRLDRVEEAVTDLQRAIALRPEFAEAQFELAMARLALGDFAAGWIAYEWRWATGAFAPNRRSFTSPLWTGAQDLAGKTVLLHAEQGFGDTIQLVRYAPLVARRGASVILEVQPGLVSLLAGIAGVSIVIARGRRLPRFDLHCPLMSLPRAFGTTPTTIPAAVPYIPVAAERAQSWAQRLPGPGPLIGVAWAGRPSHHNDLNRSLPLARLAPLFRQAGVRFVSLQHDLRAGDAAILRDHPDVIDVGAGLDDFADTAALVSRLDAVVAVDTAVAHLAGALGKPLFLLLPYAADFRWLRARADSAWYPSARLLRQTAFGDWDGVVAQLCAALSKAAWPPGAVIRPG
jgi:tetratricopeptide (TPR) repeat protein